MMEWLKSLIYGLVEGISEWLPISSTGHLIILERFIPLEISSSFRPFFLVAIQLGAVLAALLYFSRFLLSQSLKSNWMLLIKILISCLPAAVVGLFFDDFIDAYFYHYAVVSLMLVLFGVVFLYVDESPNSRKTLEQIGYGDAFVIGLFQLLSAVFPGVSRSGATIIGGLKRGLSRKVAAEYTFIMSIPVMLGASLLKLIKLEETPTESEIQILLIGAITAFVISLLTIRALIRFVQKNSFRIFGYYRIILGLLIMLTFLI